MEWTVPNILTLARILIAPVIALLPFIQGYWPKVIALIIFIIAAASDVIDGYLARSRNMVSDLGKLLDPIADKLLLFAMLVPIYWLTNRSDGYEFPLWRSLPMWVLLLLVGRELVVTLFRWVAKRRGIIIPAGGAGKLKVVFQDIFIGVTIAWFAWKDLLVQHRWAGWFQQFWDDVLGFVVALTLAVAVVLTAYSLAVYLYRYRALLRGTSSR